MSWKIFTLSEVCTLITDGVHNTPPLVDEGVPMLDSTNIGHLAIDDSNPKKFISKETDLLLSKRCKPTTGDILISSRGSIGKVAIVRSNQDFNIMGNIILLRPNPSKLDKKFLAFFFFHIRQKIEQLSKGVAQKGLYLGDVRKFKIPLPPLEEQKRIAQVLDKADRLRQKDRQLLAHYDQLLQSVFLDMFGDPVRNDKGWERKPVVEVGRVITGNTPSRAVPAYYGNHIEWIKSDNINTPSHYLTPAKEFLSEEGKRVGRTVTGDAVLITCIAGSPDCIGNIAIAGREVAFNQQINAIIPNKEELELEFIYAQILIGKKLIQQASTNGMKGMVSKGKLEEVELMVPPLRLQMKFKELFYKIQVQTYLQQQTSEKSETLFQSLLQKAFKGELALREVEAVEEQVPAKPKFVISSIL